MTYNDFDIIAMDETAVGKDMLSNTAVNKVGKKTTGNEKAKVSVCLAAQSDGTKLKPYIVFCGHKRGAKKLNEKFRANVPFNLPQMAG